MQRGPIEVKLFDSLQAFAVVVLDKKESFQHVIGAQYINDDFEDIDK